MDSHHKVSVSSGYNIIYAIIHNNRGVIYIYIYIYISYDRVNPNSSM